jgi:putative spermidine/putrescine transport system substrate-binding protein
MSRRPNNTTRRSILRGAAGAAGLTAGSGALSGFPTIWAQNIKDVTLVHLGPPVSAFAGIGDQATKDLGFKIQMQAVENADILNRFFSAPESMDVADVSSSSLPYLVGRNILQAVPLAKYKYWDKTVPLFTSGKLPDGTPATTQGTTPYSIQYATASDGQKLAKGPTDWLTGIPTLFNADTLGVRPDLVGRPIVSWAELLNPEFKGKAALQSNPTIGIMDVAMALEARGDLKYGNKGNMTRPEIDKTIDTMLAVKKAGQFRAFWSSFSQSVDLMASGETVIQSMWSPAVTAVRTRGIPCVFEPLQEGYRGWSYLFSPMKHVSGLKLDCFYDYMNWYNSGFSGAFIAREGYYSSVPETVKNFLTPAEWDYWYGGKPAATDIKDPFGKPMEKAGNSRDGGEFWHRIGHIACWNSVMDEDRYLTRRWNEFVSA